MVLRNYFRNAHDFVNKIYCRFAALRATVAKAKVAVPRHTACSDVATALWATGPRQVARVKRRCQIC